MKKFGRPLGIAGVALFLLGALGFAAAPMFKGFYVIPWFLAVVFVGLWAVGHPERIKELILSRTARYGSMSAVSIVLVLGAIIIVLALTNKHNVHWDLSGDKRHTLAPETLKVLENLSQEVLVTGFYPKGVYLETEARDLFEKYANTSPQFSYQMVDPIINPERAKAEEIKQVGTVVVEYGNETEKIRNPDEEKLTSAIIRVTHPVKKIVYFLTGHGERDPDNTEANGYSQLKSDLEKQNHIVKPLLLMQEEGIPEDAAVVVAAGAGEDLLPEETATIEKYLRQGGKVLFLIDPQTMPGLSAWLKRLGVQVGDDIVVDKMGRLLNANYLMPLVSRYTNHPVTEGFSLPSLFRDARSVLVLENMPKGIDAVHLAYTGEGSWAETDLGMMNQEGRAEFNKTEDLPGPVPMAVVGRIEVEDETSGGEGSGPTNEADHRKKQGRFLVVGDSDFPSNAYYAGPFGNSTLILSAVSWLAEDTDLVTIKTPKRAMQPLLLSALGARLVVVFTVVVLPLAVLSIGLLVWSTRRRRQ